ncbi:MAG: acyl-ACP thioesterase domain-containing protein [Oscillospiraceae bacterium]|jgi:medium-chain acyl-[acyl-carrier-protein] hydrolase
MHNEPMFQYPIQLTANDYFQNGRMKPVAYSNCIQSVAEQHLNTLCLDSLFMSSQNLAWVLVGMTIDVRAPFFEGSSLTGTTWHTETKGPYFRREFTFGDETGALVFCGATFSVVMDLSTRHVLKNYTLPNTLGSGNHVFALENVRPIFRSKANYTFCHRRPVYSSYIDALGHVNNTRYCEFAFDALSPEDVCRPLRRIALNFTGELRLGETFSVHTGLLDGTRYVRGVRDSDFKKSFDAAFTFGDEEGMSRSDVL